MDLTSPITPGGSSGSGVSSVTSTGGTVVVTGTTTTNVEVAAPLTLPQITQAANTSADGLVLADTTPATATNQQFSPRIRLTGQGWKTTSTAGSEEVDIILEAQPIQGTTAPAVTFAISRQINGAGYLNVFSYKSDGTVIIGNATDIPGSVTFQATGAYSFNGGVSAPRFSPNSSTIPGAAGIYLPAANTLGVGIGGAEAAYFDATGLHITVAGTGLSVKEGSNAKQGVATLSAGSVVVANTSVTANSRIQLTAQSLGTVSTPQALAVTARTGGTSFTITSASASDTSVVAYEIFEPG